MDISEVLRHRKYELRDYQERQVEHCLDKLFTGVGSRVSIESPTGSGKSFTIMALADLFLSGALRGMSGRRVVVSTGFNNLVFQLANQFKEFGLPTQILMGAGKLNCPDVWERKGPDSEYEPFTELDTYSCDSTCKRNHPGKSKSVCSRWESAKASLPRLTQGGQGVVVTNHSMLAIANDNLRTDLLIVDEAHTFSTFYDSYMKTELSMRQLEMINRALELGESGNIILKIAKMQIQSGRQLKKQQVDEVLSRILEESDYNGQDLYSGDYTAIKNFLEIERNTSTFSETTVARDGSLAGSYIEQFYTKFPSFGGAPTVILSATVDSYTLKMFDVPETYRYVQRNEGFVRYRNSIYLEMPDYGSVSKNAKEFLLVSDRKQKHNGLILSTNNADVDAIVEMIETDQDLSDWQVFQTLPSFMRSSAKRKVLVGSRRFFQGVDIQGLDFVCLTRIPFPLYDSRFQAWQNYHLSNGRTDIWNDLTKPIVINDIIQATGRLWRNANSRGLVCVLDPRAKKGAKFHYMVRDGIIKIREGIIVEDLTDIKEGS